MVGRIECKGNLQRWPYVNFNFQGKPLCKHTVHTGRTWRKHLNQNQRMFPPSLSLAYRCFKFRSPNLSLDQHGPFLGLGVYETDLRWHLGYKTLLFVDAAAVLWVLFLFELLPTAIYNIFSPLAQTSLRTCNTHTDSPSIPATVVFVATVARCCCCKFTPLSNVSGLEVSKILSCFANFSFDFATNDKYSFIHLFPIKSEWLGVPANRTRRTYSTASGTGCVYYLVSCLNVSEPRRPPGPSYQVAVPSRKHTHKPAACEAILSLLSSRDSFLHLRPRS